MPDRRRKRRSTSLPATKPEKPARRRRGRIPAAKVRLGYWCRHCNLVFLNVEDFHDHSEGNIEFRFVFVQEVPEEVLLETTRNFEKQFGDVPLKEMSPDMIARLRQKSGII